MAAEETALCVKRDGDRVQVPVRGLQEEGRKLSKLASSTFASGRFRLTPAQSNEAKDQLAEILWCLARLCGEMAALMDTVVTNSASEIKEPITK